MEQREGHGEGRMREEGALGSCAGGGKGKGMWELVKQQGSWHRTKPLPADTPSSSKLPVEVPGVGVGPGKEGTGGALGQAGSSWQQVRAQKGEGARVWPRSVLRTL